MSQKLNTEKGPLALIIGIDSLIGGALNSYLKQTYAEVFGTSRRKEMIFDNTFFLDISCDISEWEPTHRFSVAFFCAAVNSLDSCRRDPIRSVRINVSNTIKLAKKLIDRNVFVVFLSTNLVYDGSIPFVNADTPVSPQTEHGRQKAEAERLLLSLGDLVSVMRFSKIFGQGMVLFQNWIMKLKNNEFISPLIDKKVSPLPLSFCVEAIYRIAEARLPGIIQASGDRDVTYADIAYFIARRLNVDLKLVKPIHSRFSNLDLESVQANTTLDSSRLVKELGMKIPDVWQTIDLMITQNIM